MSHSPVGVNRSEHCSCGPDSFIIDNNFASIKVSCFHFGQYNEKFFSPVSLRIFIRVLL